MLIRIGFDLLYEVAPQADPAPMLLMLHAHPEVAARLQHTPWIVIEPALSQESFIDSFGNLAVRVVPSSGSLRLTYDNVVYDSGVPEPKIDGARLHPIAEIPLDCMQYLLSSRYCEVDRLSQMAWDLFGKTPATWERVQAVMDWVHNHIKFNYADARPTKSAYDAWYEGRGVCRDFQHLAITLLRALNVPARYATGYLGDIGVPKVDVPMDFSAWMEVYLGGRWFTVDARHNEPRIARVLMARGRDATDVALTTSFGPAVLTLFKVWTDELPAKSDVAQQAAGTSPTPTVSLYIPEPSSEAKVATPGA